jgi:uncharacterized protein YeaO (DUF488 family)
VIRVVRLGSPRATGEGLRVGTVRRPPRGVKKSDYARRDYYDVWLPELAPSEKLFRWAVSQPWTDARWRRYRKAYEREMKAPAAQRLLELLARLSHRSSFSVGCYCADEERCHRSILRTLLREKDARIG